MGAGGLPCPALPLGTEEAWTKRITWVTGGQCAVRGREAEVWASDLGLNPAHQRQALSLGAQP